MAESTSSDHCPPSGYEEDLVKEVEEDFQCPICHLPLKEPVLTRCGHRYCKECLDGHIGRQKSKEESLTCPTDRENLDPDLDIFPDKATERRVLSLAIRCPNDGCEWTGELRNKESHIRQCSKFPVTCPNSCGRSIPRDMVSNHTKDECPLTIISCPHAGMGCTTKVQRQGMEYHLESATRIHLDLVCIKLNNTEDKLNKTEDELNNTKDKLNKTEDELNDTKDKLKKTEALLNETRVELQNAIELLRLSSVKHNNVFLWRIDSFSEILKEAKNGGKDEIAGDPFYTKSETESFGYKLRVVIFPNGLGNDKNTHLSVFIVVMKGEYDAILRWPFNKKVKFTLIDQQDDPDQRENETGEIVGKNIPSFARPKREENKGWGLLNFISHLKLHSRRYIVDNTLFLQVEISSPSNTNSSLEG